MSKENEMIAKKFEDTLLETNRGFNYYVDWNNVEGYQNYSIEIHALDVLIGKTNEEFYQTFKSLIGKLPSVIEVFPYLFALSKKQQKEVRKKAELKIIGSEIDSDDWHTYSFNSNLISLPITEEIVQKYYVFFEQMGLKKLYQNHIEKSTQDYIVGVLVGSDSNGRKNRGGTAFELACEPIIKSVCQKYGVEVITQKKFETLRKYGLNVSDDIANRKADFILLNIDTKDCMNIEVNFFNGGGSKPEEIIDSYINRQKDLNDNNIKFALITDGNCWKGTTNQLQKGFRHLKYLMNYNMAKNNMLEDIIKEVFVKNK